MSASSLTRDGSTPLWAQIEADLRRRLLAGEFAEGFPTDLELTTCYGVSRHTVREAIARLNLSGVLRRTRGRGTVVDRAEFEQTLGTLYSLFRSVESTGVTQTSVVLEVGVVKDDAAAGQLGLDPDADLVLLARQRLADGVPLAVDRAWLPHEVASPLLEVDWSHTALYEELARVGAPVPDQGWERLTPVVPDGPDRDLLGLEAGAPALFLERLGIHAGIAVEWRTTLIHGDRYRFVTEWSSTSPNGVRVTTADL